MISEFSNYLVLFTTEKTEYKVKQLLKFRLHRMLVKKGETGLRFISGESEKERLAIGYWFHLK